MGASAQKGFVLLIFTNLYEKSRNSIESPEKEILVIEYYIW